MPAPPGDNVVTLLRQTDRLLLTLLVVCAVIRLWVGPHIVDDAFVTFRYADNLVSGLGFVYNAAEKVLGTSSPLFGFLLALCGVVKISAVPAAFGLSVVANLLTLILIFKVLAKAGQREAGYLACALYAVAPFSVTYAVSGMETSLYLLLVFGLLAFPGAPSWRVAVLSFLCVLCRPDGALAVAVILGARFFHCRARLPRDLLYLALLSLPWLAFLQLYYGGLLPQSLIAKAHLKRAPETSLLNFFHFFRSGWVGLQSLLLIPGAMALRKKTVVLPVKLWLVWGAVYAAVFLAANAFTDFPWYFSPLFLVQTVVSGFGVAFLIRCTMPKTAQIFCVCLLTAGAANIVRHKRSLVQMETGREFLYRNVAQELSAESLPTTTMAATEVGALGYYFNGKILDLVGLVSPETVKLGAREALLQSRARWVVSYDTHLNFQTELWFTTRYSEIKRIAVARDRNLLVFKRIGDAN